jgi:fatty acid desaturase
MNMGFHKSLGTELEHFRQSRNAPNPEPLPASSSFSRPNRLKQLVWIVAALAVAYFLTTLSAALLWGLAAVAVGLIALATAVCVYAQNNSW